MGCRRLGHGPAMVFEPSDRQSSRIFSWLWPLDDALRRKPRGILLSGVLTNIPWGHVYRFTYRAGEIRQRGGSHEGFLCAGALDLGHAFGLGCRSALRV